MQTKPLAQRHRTKAASAEQVNTGVTTGGHDSSLVPSLRNAIKRHQTPLNAMKG